MDLVTLYGVVGLAAALLITASIALDALELSGRLGCRHVYARWGSGVDDVCTVSRLAHDATFDHPYEPWIRGDRYAAAIAVLVLLWLVLALAR